MGVRSAIVIAVFAGLLRVQAQSAPSAPVPDPNSLPIAKAVPAQPVSGSATVPPQSDGIAKQSDQLLQLAAALKAEVDKSTKDTLSVAVIRKASEIEKFARDVKTGTGKDESSR